jgi:hypothetical protein
MSAAPKYIIFAEPESRLKLLVRAPRLLVPWESRWQNFKQCVGPALARIGKQPSTRLLIEWEPRWAGFKSALRPALHRSAPPLQGECPLGAKTAPTLRLTVLLHLAAILVLVIVPLQVRRLERLMAASPKQYQVIYYPGQNLPEMNDVGGAQKGGSGRSGGRELLDPSQVIRVARGNRSLDIVADAPHLQLPKTSSPVADLLTVAPNDPGPAPVRALHSLLAMANLAPPAAVAPPPPSATHSQARSAPDLIAGAVNAPPQAQRQVAGLKLPEIGAAVAVPPPISAPARETAVQPRLAMPVSVVAPPPQIARTTSDIGISGLGATAEVVPPAPQVGGRALSGQGIPGGMGKDMTAAVTPPPVTSGLGNGDTSVVGNTVKALGSLLGKITGSGPAADSAAVVSNTPGIAVGIPGNATAGSLALGPSGGNRSGAGGTGTGTGVANRAGTGSSATGVGPGASTAGNGYGDGALHPGTSLYPGPGGSGNGDGKESGMAGITIRGSNVQIPSFSSPASSPATPARGKPDPPRRVPSITVIATARSGGALNSAYGTLLQGNKVYTIYIDTSVGTAVLQFGEHLASAQEFQADLVAPEPTSLDLPKDLPPPHLLVSCILDKSGMIKNLRLLRSGNDRAAADLMAAIQKWQFRPALRGNEPVEVDAILGFGVDTR